MTLCAWCFRLVFLVKLRLDEIGQCLYGRSCICASSFEIEPTPTLGREGCQLENALAIVFIPVVMHPNLGLKVQGKLNEFVSGPHVQAETVSNLNLATGDARINAHRRLDRPGPEISDPRALSIPFKPPAVSMFVSKCTLVGFLQDFDDLFLRACLAQ